MAAYAALVSLLNDLEIIPNHATHSFSFDNQQISSLSQTAEILIDFIETYDSHGRAAKVLESIITSAAHAAHNVIESHIVDQINTGSTRCGKLRSYYLMDLQRAIDSMEFVKRKAMQFKAKSRSKATYSSPSQPAAATTSSEPLKNNVMVGFDEAVLRLVEILAGPSNQRLVIPVAGMGGLGKTSLTKAVYEHSYVREHFDVRLWATISQQYNDLNILAQLLDGENKSTTGGDAGELGEELHKRLYGSKYLIVLDDMWSLEAWDNVRRYLPENGNGSRVVVTTRLSNMADHLSSSPFNLNFLDEDKSWELFCRKAFGEEDCPVELEEIGKKIVKRCRGLPLSIVVMGGHLRRSSRGIEYWEKVAVYMNPISSVGEEEQCLEILSLSYQHLPACLKPCFLYLGIYMEDESINSSELLRHWINEGFLRAKRGLSMEEVGEDYLKDLIARNLILVASSSWSGEVIYCRTHDSVREVCLKVCKKEKFLCEVDDTTTQVRGCKVRRTVIPKGKNFNSHTIGVKQLSPSPLRLFNCSLLRVLLRDIKIHENGTCLPSAHFEQVNLLALDLEQNMLQSLYSILTSLPTCWNLQTLHMMYTSPSSCEPMSLPYEIWEMPQLRILKAHSIFLTDPVPAEGSDQQEEGIILRNLHTLEGVVNLRLTEEVCKRMPNLKKLKLRYDLFCDDYGFQNFGHFNRLKSLRISFDDDSKWCDVVPTLTLPTSLEELHLHNSHLGWGGLTRMVSSPLPNLAWLLVWNSVRGSEWNLDDEEVFCSLKRLVIQSCADLIYWKANSSHFPVLESLELYNMPKLSEIPLDIGDIPTLRFIYLSSCGASAAVSAVRMVMEQEIDYGNHDIQLRIHFWASNREEFERFEETMEEECLITTNNIHLFFNGRKIEKTLF